MVNGRELRAPPPLNEQKEGQCMKFIMDVGPFQRLSRPSAIFHLPFLFFFSSSLSLVIGVRISNDYITRKQYLSHGEITERNDVSSRERGWSRSLGAPLTKFEITLANFKMQIVGGGRVYTLFATINFRFNWIGLL